MPGPSDAMTAAFDLDRTPATSWPADLEPIGENSFYKEPFDVWWARHRERLGHLPPDLAEQWIHRHWLHSPFSFLPLDTLGWERRAWNGDMLLASIHRAWGGGNAGLNPEFDYRAFQGKGGDDRLQTARELDAGSWVMPIVLLATPSGIVSNDQLLPDVRLVLVEGHQRHRYLNALDALRRSPAGPHETIILHSPLVEPLG